MTVWMGENTLLTAEPAKCRPTIFPESFATTIDPEPPSRV